MIETAEPEEELVTEVPEEKPAKKPRSPRRKKSALRRMLNYRWILQNLRFFLFLAVLAVLYIYNGHNADKTVRNMARVNRELKELQHEYKTIRSEVMFRSKQSELARAVEPFGLKELLAPPYVLKDSLRDAAAAK